MGTVMSGAFFSWLLCVNPLPYIIPQGIKLYTIFLVSFFFIFMYLVYIRGLSFYISSFFCSMCFLGGLHRILRARRFNLGKIAIYNELTFMEYIRGKGLSVVFPLLSAKAQQFNDLKIHQIINIIRFFLIIFIIFNCH